MLCRRTRCNWLDFLLRKRRDLLLRFGDFIWFVRQQGVVCERSLSSCLVAETVRRTELVVWTPEESRFLIAEIVLVRAFRYECRRLSCEGVELILEHLGPDQAELLG